MPSPAWPVPAKTRSTGGGGVTRIGKGAPCRSRSTVEIVGDEAMLAHNAEVVYRDPH